MANLLARRDLHFKQAYEKLVITVGCIYVPGKCVTFCRLHLIRSFVSDKLYLSLLATNRYLCAFLLGRKPRRDLHFVQSYTSGCCVIVFTYIVSSIIIITSICIDPQVGASCHSRYYVIYGPSDKLGILFDQLCIVGLSDRSSVKDYYFIHRKPGTKLFGIQWGRSMTINVRSRLMVIRCFMNLSFYFILSHKTVSILSSASLSKCLKSSCNFIGSQPILQRSER